MNEEKKEVIVRLAHEEGFADVCAIPHQSGTLFLLFCSYKPSLPAKYGEINISNYYVTSQQGYLSMQNILLKLKKMGFGAEEYKEHGIKDLAVRTGGFQGKNSLYYHEQYGSFVSIHAIQTDFACEIGALKEKKECPQCGNCFSACPTNAIAADGFCREQCIRHYMGEKVIPYEYGQFIYQLFGCERCQLACPYNNTELGEAYSYDLIEVIEGKHTKEIRSLVGANYGRRRIIVGQAILYAANVCYLPALEAIENLMEDEWVGKTANKAAEILKKS